VVDHAEKSVSRPDASTDLAFDRTHFAYERTLLAWVRTATLITFGFAIQQFFRIARAGTPDGKVIIGTHGFGLTMISVGLLALHLATLQHRSDMLALQHQYPAVRPTELRPDYEWEFGSPEPCAFDADERNCEQSRWVKNLAANRP